MQQYPMTRLQQKTQATQARYQRMAPMYDRMDALSEGNLKPWRERLWSMVKGPRVLEVGVGTGKNMPFYPPGMVITGIDLTPGMLERAKKRALELNVEVDLQLNDVQRLAFRDNTFDTAVATCVFCSVPDPILGLKEMLRVIKPGGQALFIEHVRSEKFLLGALMDLLNPLVLSIMGPNINRRTVQNVQRAGWKIIEVKNLGISDIFKMIIAQKPG